MKRTGNDIGLWQAVTSTAPGMEPVAVRTAYVTLA